MLKKYFFSHLGAPQGGDHLGSFFHPWAPPRGPPAWGAPRGPEGSRGVRAPEGARGEPLAEAPLREHSPGARKGPDFKRAVRCLKVMLLFI